MNKLSEGFNSTIVRLAKLEKEAENITLKKKIDEFKQALINYKYAHKRGRDSALDDATREFHRGAFIAIGYILSLLKRRFE